MGSRVNRFDTTRLDKAAVTRLGSGALRVPAVLTRVGVFDYRDAVGKVVREYRPPDEVFHADSVASMADVSLTIGHPSGMVDASNWERLSVGHVSGTPTKDAQTNGLLAPVVVTKSLAIKRVDAGELRDVSSGYTVELDPTPGVTPDGQPYDVVQRQIRYNHVALLKRGDGRQGTQVGLRLDSANNEICADENPCEGPVVNMKLTLKVDGKAVEVEAGSAEHINAQAKIDAAHDAAIVELTKRCDTAETALKAANDKLTAIATKAKADARTALEASAKAPKALGPDAKFDGKSDREIMVAVIQKADSAFVDDASKVDAYVEARFDTALAALASAPAPKGKQTEAARALEAPRAPAAKVDHAREDAAEPDITADPQAYAEYVQAQYNRRVR